MFRSLRDGSECPTCSRRFSELKPVNVRRLLPGKWLDTLVRNFSWHCQLLSFRFPCFLGSRFCTPTHTEHRDWFGCPGVTAATDCVSHRTSICIMLQVVDLFMEATQKKVNSLVRRTKAITVNPEYFVRHEFSYAWDHRPFVCMKYSYSRWLLRNLRLNLNFQYAFYFCTEATSYEIRICLRNILDLQYYVHCYRQKFPGQITYTIK